MEKTLHSLITETDERAKLLLLLQLKHENRHLHQSFHTTKQTAQAEKQQYNRAQAELEATKATFYQLSAELADLRQQHRSYLDQIDSAKVNLDSFDDVKMYFEEIIQERQDLISQNAALKAQINELLSRRERIINDIKQFDQNIREWLQSGTALLNQ
jgi:predicted nuclease with TOPRIM domain